VDANNASLHATRPRRTGQIVGITVEVAASTQPAGEPTLDGRTQPK
jgi:hypothetical protein